MRGDTRSTKHLDLSSASSDSSYEPDLDSGDDEPETLCFLFGCELNALQRQHTVKVDGEDWMNRSKMSEDSNANSNADSNADSERNTKPTGHLYLKQVTLKGDAEPGQRNIIELESTDTKGDLVRFTIASLAVGVQEMASLDLDFDINEEITLYLTEGSGTVVVTGKQEVCYPPMYLDDSDDYEEVSEEEGEEVDGDEESEEKLKQNAYYFSVSRANQNAQTKKRSLKRPRDVTPADSSEGEEDEAAEEENGGSLEKTKDLRYKINKSPAVKRKKIIKSPKNTSGAHKIKTKSKVASINKTSAGRSKQ